MDDYYSYAPTVALARPLALIGFAGAPTKEVAHQLAVVTGLAVRDVPRWVEAQEGKSRAEIYLREGEHRLRALEASMVERALTEQPAGIVVLSDDALLDDDVRIRVRKKADLVYLRAELADLFDRMLHDLEAEPGSHPFWVGGPPASPSELLPTFDRRAPGYREADLVIDIRRRGSIDIVRELKRRLAELS